MPRPDRHHCPGLQFCYQHPRWNVCASTWSFEWLVFGPYRAQVVRGFATHAEAIRYATTRARAELADAIQNQPSEVCS